MIEVNRQGEVWVFAEQEEGTLNDVSLELCGKARQLAEQLGVPMGTVLPGSGVKPLAQRLIAQGADRVYLVDDPRLRHYQTLPYAKSLVRLVEKYQPQIVMFGATAMGRDLAPRVASSLRARARSASTAARRARAGAFLRSRRSPAARWACSSP